MLFTAIEIFWLQTEVQLLNIVATLGSQVVFHSSNFIIYEDESTAKQHCYQTEKLINSSSY